MMRYEFIKAVKSEDQTIEVSVYRDTKTSMFHLTVSEDGKTYDGGCFANRINALQELYKIINVSLDGPD